MVDLPVATVAGGGCDGVKGGVRSCNRGFTSLRWGAGCEGWGAWVHGTLHVAGVGGGV